MVNGGGWTRGSLITMGCSSAALMSATSWRALLGIGSTLGWSWVLHDGKTRTTGSCTVCRAALPNTYTTSSLDTGNTLTAKSFVSKKILQLFLTTILYHILFSLYILKHLKLYTQRHIKTVLIVGNLIMQIDFYIEMKIILLFLLYCKYKLFYYKCLQRGA